MSLQTMLIEETISTLHGGRAVNNERAFKKAFDKRGGPSIKRNFLSNYYSKVKNR